MSFDMSPIDAVLAANNLDTTAFASVKVKALVAVAMCTESMRETLFPASFGLPAGRDGVGDLLNRLAIDEALFVSALRAIGTYVVSRQTNDQSAFSHEALEKFRTSYTESTEENKRIGLTGTLRMFDDSMNMEVERVTGNKAGDKSFEELVEALKDDPKEILLLSLEMPIGFTIAMAQYLSKAEKYGGLTTTQALDMNRLVVQINMQIQDELADQLCGPITQFTAQHLLPQDQYEILDALLERQVEGGGVTH